MSEAVSAKPSANDVRLFWACFIALVATAFGFIIRVSLINQWGDEFGLSETQKGEILGVGLWPFAVSIILFSLIIDKIGYGVAMIFAFCCYVASSICLMTANPSNGYQVLYFGSLILALGNGTVEAVINPVVATMFSQQKTKWLNILHAGWPGGLVIAGIIMILMGGIDEWRIKVALIFIPAIAFGVLMLGCKFPVQERVKAGVSYREMLQETGVLGAFVASFLMVAEVGRFFDWPMILQAGLIICLVVGFGFYVQAIGRLMFAFLLLVMILLATTELGTDSWVTALMEPSMAKIGLDEGWVLVYTSFIMMILRFFAGPIVHRISPLGLLALSCVIAVIGLLCFSVATVGVMILVAATIYGFGKTFFWPTMLGVVSEQFPRGGAVTLNTIAGVGMLGVGVLGGPGLGFVQETSIVHKLETTDPELFEQVRGEETRGIFGTYVPIDPEKIKALPEEQQAVITGIQNEEKRAAFRTVAILPCIMFVCYLGLIFYFKARGGYKAEVLVGHEADDAEFTGGTEGPGEG
ncbi:Major Facilitator Superfamily protein [Planctomycetes bacterium Pan216]|uniref:Major Facilitator Superfamily protein n=1 Tax=Kolteria novifilia TaxID=2527975 RepID=A0A518BCU0_9BACT|nr:Major Facilitator Superfamily protein [Planctomycetes bacterium Pan216]